MLAAVGVKDFDDLFSQIPDQYAFHGELPIRSAMDQIALGKHMRALAARNASADDYPCFLGGGVYDHYVPPTVAAITGRSEFYTSYTPYQPEVSQGVLQSIFEFQTLVTELFGMDLANASMYDSATGLAEAAIMACDLTGRKRVVVAGTVNPTSVRVLETYLRHMGITIDFLGEQDGVSDVAALRDMALADCGAVLFEHPNYFGNLEDARGLVDAAHQAGALAVACVDPISLGILQPPGHYDVDIAVGEGQGLGCPPGYGGPLLGLFACKRSYMRRLPGRIVGETRDIEGKRAFVMTLRTREQDIRRERATSNICTNVALYALAATVYMATMGKQGLRRVAELCLQKAHYAASEITKVPGFAMASGAKFFKEFTVKTSVHPKRVNERLWEAGIIGGIPHGENRMIFAVTEQRTREEIDRLVSVLRKAA